MVPLHPYLGKTESAHCLSDHWRNLVTIAYQSLTTDIQQVRRDFLCGTLLVVIIEECSFRTKEELIKSGEMLSLQTCAWGCSTNDSNSSNFLTGISGCLANAVKTDQTTTIRVWWAKGHKQNPCLRESHCKERKSQVHRGCKMDAETPSSLNDWFVPTHVT